MDSNNNTRESLQQYMERNMNEIIALDNSNNQDWPVVEFEYDPIAKQLVHELAKRESTPMSQAAQSAMLIALDEVISNLDTTDINFPTQLASVLCSQQKIRISDTYAKKYTKGNKIADPVLGRQDIVWLRNTLELILDRKVPPSWDLIEPGYSTSKVSESVEASDIDADDYDDYVNDNNWEEEDDLDDEVEEEDDYIP